MSFGKRLEQAMSLRGPLCVGIDPHAALLLDWGLKDNLASLEKFSLSCIEAFGDIAAVVKPQSAFYERFGSRGIAILERTILAARASGALVLLDVKRGDIGSTMAAYADAYLDQSSEIAVDAITVNPYLGVGALEPAFERAEANDAGIFVLALTSNPEAPEIQHAQVQGGSTVAQEVVTRVAARNSEPGGLGSFGLVVGATIGDSIADLSRFNGPLLVPGIGAQGGTAEDVRRIFAGRLASVLPSVSREVLRAGPVGASLRVAAEQAVQTFAFLREAESH